MTVRNLITISKFRSPGNEDMVFGFSVRWAIRAPTESSNNHA